MANEIALTAAQIGMINPLKCKIKTYLAHEAITAGQAVYSVTASGKAGLATAAAANNLAQFRGIALQTVGAGQAVDVLEEGELYGFTITQDYDAVVYLHDTAGTLSTTNGTVHVRVGRISQLTDGSTLTKVLSIVTRRDVIWA